MALRGDLVGALHLVGSLDLGDWLSFVVEPDADMPRITGESMVYDGFRFRAEAKLGGKLYGDPFGVDIGIADVLTTEPDVAQGSRFLEFAGIGPPTFRLCPRHAHSKVTSLTHRTSCRLSFPPA